MENLIGHTIDRYHILEQLGRGGMATVYKAYDTRLERDVAIKIIRREAFPAENYDRILKRFEREAKAMAKLSHPNIVKVHDYGEHNGLPYLVLEYLPGGSIKKYLGQSMDWRNAAKLILPIAKALDYANQRGFIHRDIKPSNILITDSGEPMLSDFGIAKILNAENTQTLTATGVGVGTPVYMSPEQGMGQDIDARADVYSLGIVFYELITGRKPFEADTPMAVVVKHLHDPLPCPTQYISDLPEKVEKILYKCLAKQPQDRYADMGAFAKTLKDALTGQNGILSPSRPIDTTKTKSKGSGADVTQDELIGKSIEPSNMDQASIDEKPKWIKLTLIGAGVLFAFTFIFIISMRFSINDKNEPESQSSTNVAELAGIEDTKTPIPPSPTNSPEPTATETSFVYHVKIEVIDEEGDPISDAKIIRGETTEYTNSRGIWSDTTQETELTLNVWAQGYKLQEHLSTLQQGDNEINIQLSPDPLGLQLDDIERDGYELVFVEDFQDQISDCSIEGNGEISLDDTNVENYLLLVDLRSQDTSFICNFGPTGIQDAIIEADFRYKEIQYYDFDESDQNGYYNWQGYVIGLREGIDVEGYPLRVSWGPTLQIRDFRNDEWEFPITTPQSIQENRWYTLNSKYDGATLEVRMNGTLRFTYSSTPLLDSKNGAYISAFTGSFIQFDNIKMWIPKE